MERLDSYQGHSARAGVLKQQEEKMKKLLIVVDYQNDFVTGSLGFEKAVELEEPIAARIREYREMGEDGQIIFTMDTHDRHYMESQ